MKGRQYSKALVGVYADLISYASNQQGRPIDESFGDVFSLYGTYFCTWYNIDCIYAFVPNLENGTVKYLSAIKKGEEGVVDENMAGVNVHRRLTPNEMVAWHDSLQFAVEDSERYRNGTNVMLRITDCFGNRVLVGADTSSDRMQSELIRGFVIVALFLLVIVLLIAGLLYLMLKHMVTNPARSIARQMSDYLSDGKRKAVTIKSEGDDEFSLIADAFNYITGQIDTYIGDIETLGRERERQQAEVDIAAGIQQAILPTSFAYLKNCAIKAVMKPARLIGGDLYDYLEIDSAHTLAVVADVSGKGIPSAFVMAMALTSIRQYARMGYGPAAILKHTNEVFAADNPQMMFVTAFVGILDSGAGTFTYSNAGHNLPYLIHDTPQLLDGSAGTPLGLFPGEEYEDAVAQVCEGDSIFLYTDGVNEAVNGVGEFFGTDRLEKVLRDTAGAQKRHFVEAVDEAVHAFAAGAEQSDDITMLSCFIHKRKVLELGYDVREFAAIRDHILASSIPQEYKMDLCVAAEECFVNICSYAFDGPAPEGERIVFELAYASRVVMTFSDGGKQFDPRHELPNLDEYDIDSAVGGLGRLIAFKVADSVDYEYKDGRNVLTIVKSIKK